MHGILVGNPSTGFTKEDCSNESVFGDVYTNVAAVNIGGKWEKVVKAKDFGERVVWMAEMSSLRGPSKHKWYDFYKAFWGGLLEHFTKRDREFVTEEVQHEHWLAALQQ